MKICSILLFSIIFISCSEQMVLTSNNFIDSDLDGVYDYRDNCPNEPGSLFNLGCPNTDQKLSLNYNETKSTDSDLDGIPDSQDECPLIYGSPFNMGCQYSR